MKRKHLVILAIILALVIALAAGVTACNRIFSTSIRCPEVDTLEEVLKEEYPQITSLRVTMARPSAEFQIHVKEGDSQNLLALTKTIADYLNENQIYEQVLMPRFRSPYIWASGIKITFYEGWGPFARLLQEYECTHDSSRYSYQEIAELGFCQWQLMRDALDPDRPLPQVVYDRGP